MNKAAGETIGALFGGAVMVECDEGGAAIGKCIRLWVNIDIYKHLLRWSNINIGVSQPRSCSGTINWPIFASFVGAWITWKRLADFFTRMDCDTMDLGFVPIVKIPHLSMKSSGI